MKSVEVLKDCRSLNAAAEMNCPMPRSVDKVPIRNEKRCSHPQTYMTEIGFSSIVRLRLRAFGARHPSEFVMACLA